MDRHSCGTHATQSSIALLQERFRQLEEAKAMRQFREKQLCRSFSKSDQTPWQEPFRQHPHSEVMYLHMPSLQQAVYLQQELQKEHVDLLNIEAQETREKWQSNAEVDTSLRL